METLLRLGLSMLGVGLCVPGLAHANDDLDRAIALAGEAEFEASLEALEQAAASGPLTRAELVRLLQERAQVRFALGAHEAMLQDIAQLATLSPNLVLPPTSPPQIRRAFEAQRPARGQRLGVRAEVERDGASVTIRAVILGEARGLVQGVRVAARAGQSPWEERSGEEVRVAVPRDISLSYYVELLGPGGAVLARQGDADAPERVGASAPSLAVSADGASDDALAWGLGLGGAGAAVIATVVVAVVVASGSGAQRTLVTGPTVER